MLFLPEDIGGTIRWRAPRRADAGPTVEVLDAYGGSRIAAGTAATLDAVNTTTAGAIAAGSTASFSLASGANVTVGDEYLVGPNAAGRREFVRCAGIDGTTFTPQYPPLFSYASGVGFVGTYLSYTIAGASVPNPSRNWRAIFSWNLSTVAQPPGIVAFDVVRHYCAHQPATINDVRAYDPRATDRVAASFDWERAFAQALNDVIRDLNASDSARGHVTDDDWRELVALRVLAYQVAPTLGPGLEKYAAEWRERYSERYETYKAQFRVDRDQDGAIERHEQYGFGGRILRA